jgi:hypothetical protein
MNRKILIPITFAFFTGAGFAQTSSTSPTFDDLDTNSDGTLTQQEITSGASTVDFTSADKDANGMLSRDEYDMASGSSTGSGAAGSTGGATDGSTGSATEGSSP